MRLAVVVFIIVAGARYVDAANWTPFIPPRGTFTDALGGTHAAYGMLGVVAGAAYIFFAYIGFDTVSTHAGEAKNPQKDVPFGIITSLIVCTILYILVALVLTGMVNYKDIDIKAPIAAAFGAKGLNFAVFIISVAAIAGLTSVNIVMLLGQSRIFYAISKDGLLPKKTFGELHPKFRTPWKSNILIGAMVYTTAAFTPSRFAIATSSFTLFAGTEGCTVMRVSISVSVRPPLCTAPPLPEPLWDAAWLVGEDCCIGSAVPGCGVTPHCANAFGASAAITALAESVKEEAYPRLRMARRG